MQNAVFIVILLQAFLFQKHEFGLFSHVFISSNKYVPPFLSPSLSFSSTAVIIGKAVKRRRRETGSENERERIIFHPMVLVCGSRVTKGNLAYYATMPTPILLPSFISHTDYLKIRS